MLSFSGNLRVYLYVGPDFRCPVSRGLKIDDWFPDPGPRACRGTAGCLRNVFPRVPDRRKVRWRKGQTTREKGPIVSFVGEGAPGRLAARIATPVSPHKPFVASDAEFSVSFSAFPSERKLEFPVSHFRHPGPRGVGRLGREWGRIDLWEKRALQLRRLPGVVRRTR